jgi:hypothetical protein
MSFLSKYNVAKDYYIPIIKRSVVDFAVSGDWTPAAGDVKISIDGGAVANIGTLPTAVVSGNGAFWKFPLTAGEHQGKYVIVVVSDAATKAVEDQSFIIETFGHASSQYPGIDWIDPNIAVDNILKRDMSAVTGEASRSPLNALRFLRNKWTIIGTTLSIKKEDDTAEAWNATITATAGVDPITGVDPS